MIVSLGLKRKKEREALEVHVYHTDVPIVPSHLLAFPNLGDLEVYDRRKGGGVYPSVY
jgi:hypothetical protein